MQKEKAQGGILYGIGVGPGEPELLTHKAVQVIECCDTIVVPSATSTVDTKGLREKCFEAMNDDLNSPIVISHLFDAARAINSIKDGKATITEEDLKELQEVFHLFLFDILGMKDEASASGNSYETFGKAVDLLLSIRQQAKANKDWATSDKIRNELIAMGFEIKDTKDGAEWKLSK